MRVRMRIGITGYRNGQPWPPKGGELELPDHEATDMIAAGYAEAVAPARPGALVRPAAGAARDGEGGKADEAEDGGGSAVTTDDGAEQGDAPAKPAPKRARARGRARS